MATLNAKLATDMTLFDVSDIRDGTPHTDTDTDWEVIGAAGPNLYSFAGESITYTGGGGNPVPNGGLISSLSVSESGALQFKLAGLIVAAHVGDFVLAGDSAGLLQEWFSGDDTFKGSVLNDHLIGYAGKDAFNLANGGSDIADGGHGDDTFTLGGALDAGDTIRGGPGVDSAYIAGDYTIAFTATTLASVEKLILGGGHNYNITLTGGNVDAGGLTVDARALGGAVSAVVTMAAAAHNGFTALGGLGDDTFNGASGDDVFHTGEGDDSLHGDRGADVLRGGPGHDLFVYVKPADSTGSTYDTITDFAAANDVFAVNQQVRAVDAWLKTGPLSSATFDADLALAIDADHLGKHHVVLFTPDSGTLVGETFLVIEANGQAGYQAGLDYVIHLSDDSHLAHLDAGNFSQAG